MKITIEKTKELEPIDLVAALCFISIVYGLPDVSDLWTEAYPLDPMTDEEASIIMFEGVANIKGYHFYSQDDVTLILDQMDEVGLSDLADLVRTRLAQSRQ